MIVSGDVPTLDALQKQMQAIPNEKDLGRKLTLRAQFIDDACRYLNHHLKQSNGIVTPEILQDADALYDVDGFPTKLTALLGYELRELQQALGRFVDVSCERCKQSFTLIEPRRLRGYTEHHEKYCERCRRIVYEQEQLKWKNISETEQQNAAYAVKIDAEIVGTLYPLDHPTYRAKLLAFLQCWQTGDWVKPLVSGPYYTSGAGCCMLCGGEDMYIYITRSIRIPRDSLFLELMEMFDPLPREASKYGYHYEPLDTYHQALWRLPPILYFSAFPDYPLMLRPILCLCDDCGMFVERTHELCDLSDQSKPIIPFDNKRFRSFLIENFSE